MAIQAGTQTTAKPQEDDMMREDEDSDQLSEPAKLAMDAMLSMQDVSSVMPHQEPLAGMVATEPAYEAPEEPALLKKLPGRLFD